MGSEWDVPICCSAFVFSCLYSNFAAATRRIISVTTLTIVISAIDFSIHIMFSVIATAHCNTAASIAATVSAMRRSRLLWI